MVNNGSKDESSEILKQLKAHPQWGPYLKRVDVFPNQGYGYGIWQGLQVCDSEFIAWSHADQQCDPRNAFLALDRILNQPPELRTRTLVKGVRLGRDAKDRMVSTVFAGFALVLLQHKLWEINAQPKVFHRSLLQNLKNPPWTFAFDIYVLTIAKRLGFQFINLPVLFPPRVHGLSNWAGHFKTRYKTILGLIAYMWKLRWELSKSPLQQSSAVSPEARLDV